MLSSIHFSLSITGPIFLLIFLGLLLKRSGVISTEFADQASALCFKLFLPALLFFNIIELPLAKLFKPGLLAVLLGLTFGLYLTLEWLVPKFRRLDDCRGEFIQSCFRANLAIIGLAFCERAYGEEGLGVASMLVAILTISYNIFAVITLQRHIDSGQNSMRRQLLGIIKNPLIIAISLALVMNPIAGFMPVVFKQAGAYLAQVSLPLALLCVGASLTIRGAGNNVTAIAWSAVIKLLIKPALAVLILVLLGFSKLEIGVAFLLLSAPVAAASFVMVVALGGNRAMAANFIVYSSILSLFSVSAGLALLRSLAII